MTGQSRRRLIAFALVAALAVPVEAVLVAALRTPNADVAAREWASSLSDNDLQDVALRIQDYTYLYRRAIMTALEPDGRSQVWRRYLTTYLQSHQPLDITSRALITRAIAAMTPEVFDDNPPADRVAELATIFDISVQVFGRATATDLFMRLGPDDGSDQALPVRQRLADNVRNWMTVYARSADCECSTHFATSCDISGAAGDACSDATGCEPDISWPMCGVAWAAPCNGTCTAIQRKVL
jgi:hypothetical protein